MPKLKRKSPKALRKDRRLRYEACKHQLSEQKAAADDTTKGPEPIAQTQEPTGFPVLCQIKDAVTGPNPLRVTTGSHNENVLDSRSRKRLYDRKRYMRMRGEIALKRKDAYKKNKRLRAKIIQKSTCLYHASITHRMNTKKRSKARYRHNPEFRQLVQKASIQRYASQQLHRDRVKLLSIFKYSTYPEHQESVKAASILKYATNPEHRENVKAASILNYATNPAHREKAKQASRIKFASNPDFRRKLREAKAKRYATDANYRKKCADRIRQKYLRNAVFRSKVKQYAEQRYAVDCYKARAIANAKKQRAKQTAKKRDIDFVIKQFKKSCKQGPEYVCCVCQRLLFKTQVQECEPEKFTVDTELRDQCISTRHLHRCGESCTELCNDQNSPRAKLWICATCKSHLSRGQCPPLATINSLQPAEIPPELANMNTLEQQLVAKHIMFTKVVSLPQGGQRGVKGPTVCVPADITSTTTVLPRPKKDIEIIPLKLKRKLEYKGHVDYREIDTRKVQRALRYLVANNPLYGDVTINENWGECDEILDEIITHSSEPYHNEQTDNHYMNVDYAEVETAIVNDCFEEATHTNPKCLHEISEDEMDTNEVDEFHHTCALHREVEIEINFPDGASDAAQEPIEPSLTEKSCRKIQDADTGTSTKLCLQEVSEDEMDSEAIHEFQQRNSSHREVQIEINFLDDSNGALQEAIETNSRENSFKEMQHDINSNADTEEVHQRISMHKQVEAQTNDDLQEVIETHPTKGNVEEAQDEMVTGDEIDEQDDPNALRGVCNDTCLQPVEMMSEALSERQDVIYSIAPGERNKPVSIFSKKEEDVEATAFPCLFPDTLNTYASERQKKLSLSKYFNGRLFSSDRRYASNPPYIFYAQYVTELNRLFSSISIAMRKGSTKTRHGKTITARTLSDKDEMNKLLKSDEGFRNMECLRGSPAYWKKTLSDLFAMIRQSGIPTFFCTFSSAELSRWPEVVECIARQEGKNSESSIKYPQRCKYLRENPTTAVRMFQQRVNKFITDVLKSEAEPIGKIVDHFYRIEFQQRGAPHIHCLFWIEGAPKLGEDDDSDVCAFIDKYITAHLPDEQADPKLNEAVKNVQTHRKKHTESCRKGKKTCRYNFPKCVANKTFINRPDSIDPENEEEANIDVATAKKCLTKLATLLTGSSIVDKTVDQVIKESGFDTYDQFQQAMRLVTTKTEVVLERNTQDVWINPYNKDLLKAWDGNMDIQYVLDPYSCVMYILSYISKSEHELGELLRFARDELQEKECCPDLRAQMKKLGLVYFENREVSIQESIVRTCSIQLKDSSRQVIFIPTENATRMSKPLAQIQELAKGNEDDEDIWMTSTQDRYLARPETREFESMCQAVFVSKYRVIPKREGQKKINNPNVHILLNDKGYIMKRTKGKDAVIRFAKFSETNNPEKFYMTLLKLYLPFRTIGQLKPARFGTAEEFFKNGAVRLSGAMQAVPVRSITEENRKLFEHSSSELENAWQILQTQGPLEDAWSMVAPEADIERRQAEQERENDHDDDALPPEPQPDIDGGNRQQIATSLISMEWLSDNMLPLLQAMNEKQKQVFYHIQNWCINESLGKEQDPFFLFVTGGGGTGKSHLIKCIYHQAAKLLRNPDSPSETKILLTAPTGTAAFNIKGFTVHSALKIPRQPNSIYEPLSCEALNTLQSQLAGLNILVIDEVSMVDPKLLSYIHGRLKQIKQIRGTDRKSLFGGVSILAVGDFYQLPPVKAKSLCVPSAHAGHALWQDNFEKIELDEIMRQRDDVSFANTLNNCRILKKHACLNEIDHEALASRADLPNTPDTALHVFATNAKVNIHNSETLLKLCSSIIVLQAQDYVKNPKSSIDNRSDTPRNGQPNDLADSLLIAAGARVMLMRNTDVSDGLVNGAFGTVVEIIQDNLEAPASAVHVKFDNPKVGAKQQLQNKAVPIKPYEEQMLSHKSVRRRQFPLKLAWACTVHKVQGMTVDEIVYGMDGTFSSGQAYVALSRVTKLSGLYIKNYDPKYIWRSEDIHEGVQKMNEFSPPDSFLAGKNIEITLTVLSHNVQGLRSKMEDIKANKAVMNVDVIAITETWLNANVPESAIQLPGYSLFRQDRHDGRGGVCMYVAEHFMTKNHVHRIQCRSAVECCAIQLHIPSKRPIIIIAVYRPPGVPVGRWLPHLHKLLDEISHLRPSANLILTGDMNEDLLKGHNKIELACMQHHNLQQCLPPQRTTRYGSMLDVVYANCPEYETQATVVPTYYSDHDCVKAVLHDAELVNGVDGAVEREPEKGPGFDGSNMVDRSPRTGNSHIHEHAANTNDQDTSDFNQSNVIGDMNEDLFNAHNKTGLACTQHHNPEQYLPPQSTTRCGSTLDVFHPNCPEKTRATVVPTYSVDHDCLKAVLHDAELVNEAVQMQPETERDFHGSDMADECPRTSNNQSNKHAANANGQDTSGFSRSNVVNECLPTNNSHASSRVSNAKHQTLADFDRFVVVGDGNCLFRSLALQIFKDENQHRIIRRNVVNTMTTRQQDYQMYIDGPFREHVNNMSKCRGGREIWGTEAEIIAAANFYNVTIVVFDNQINRCTRLVFEPTTNMNNDTIYIVLENEHYDLLKERK